MFSSGASYLWFSCTRDLNNEEINLSKLGFEHNEFWKLLHTGLCAASPSQLSAEPHFPSITILSVSFHALCLPPGWEAAYTVGASYWMANLCMLASHSAGQHKQGGLCCSLPLDRSTDSHLSIIQTLIFTEPLNDWPLFYKSAWNEPKATVGTSKIHSQHSQISFIWWRNQSKMSVQKLKSTFKINVKIYIGSGFFLHQVPVWNWFCCI